MATVFTLRRSSSPVSLSEPEPVKLMLSPAPQSNATGPVPILPRRNAPAFWTETACPFFSTWAFSSTVAPNEIWMVVSSTNATGAAMLRRPASATIPPAPSESSAPASSFVPAVTLTPPHAVGWESVPEKSLVNTATSSAPGATPPSQASPSESAPVPPPVYTTFPASAKQDTPAASNMHFRVFIALSFSSILFCHVHCTIKRKDATLHLRTKNISICEIQFARSRRTRASSRSTLRISATSSSFALIYSLKSSSSVTSDWMSFQ